METDDTKKEYNWDISNDWEMQYCKNCAYLTIKVDPTNRNKPNVLTEIALCRKHNFTNAEYFMDNDEACPDFVLNPEIRDSAKF